MDALAMLREDHRKVKELFRQFEEAQDKATKKAAAETALVELNIHAIIEEEIFYPAVRRQGNGTTQLVARAEQEHHTAEQLMDELMKMDAGNIEFDAKFHVLIENVKKHIEEEEAEMLPQAAEVGMARLERLGQQMEQRKQELMQEGNGRAPSRRRASTSGTRTRRTSTTSTRRKSATGTRRTTASGTRRTTASGTRRTTASGTRRTAASGTTKRASASGTRASTARAKSAAGTTASRAKTTAKRTVKTAGSKSPTTKSRSNTASRRSGSQSGR